MFEVLAGSYLSIGAFLLSLRKSFSMASTYNRGQGAHKLLTDNELTQENGPCFYRFKEGMMIDPYEYYRIHGELPYDRLDEIREEEFLVGTLETIAIGLVPGQLKAIRDRREQEFLSRPT